MYSWLKFSFWILLSALQNHPSAKICALNGAKVKEYVNTIGDKYKNLCPLRVWGAADGLKIQLQRLSPLEIQKQFINDWTNNTFIILPDGKILMCVLNCPGTWHDSTMAEYGVYQGMKRVWELHKAQIIVDQAFRVADKPFLLRSHQQDPEGPQSLRMNCDATLVCQLLEWGMKMIQGSFP